MKEKIIEEILSNAKDTFLEGIDPEIHEKMLIAYKHYLLEEYGGIIDSKDDKEQLVRICTKLEKQKWPGQSMSQKMARIIKDENLDKIREISGIAYKKAQRKIGFLLSGDEYIPDISAEQVNEYIKQLEELLDKVKPFNIYVAQTAVSEGILDFQYAANLTEDKSLRVGRIK